MLKRVSVWLLPPAVLLLLAVIALISVELAARATVRARPALREYVAWHTTGTTSATWTNEAAAYVRFRPNRALPDVNSYGFHSPELKPRKPVGQRRLVFLGGSTTYDAGPIEATYPHFVAQFLRDHDVRVAYVNMGGSGYTSTESLITYHLRGDLWSPDLVVFYNGRNDLFLSGNDRYTPDDLTNLWQPPYFEPPPVSHQRLCRLSYAYALFAEKVGYYSYDRNNFVVMARRGSEAARRVGLPKTVDEFIANVQTRRVMDVYRRNIEALCALTGARGTHLLLVGYDFAPDKIRSSESLPSDRGLSRDEQRMLARIMGDMNTILEEAAAAHPHVLYLNLEGRIRRGAFLDDCHLDDGGKLEKGNIVGQFIIDHRAELGW